MALQWGGPGESRRAGSRLGEGLWSHFHSGLKESKGTGVEVVLKEVRRQSGTEEP